MTSRERIINALEFKPMDKIGLESDVWAVALYEHGQKVRELFKTVEGDFAPVSDTDYPMPNEQDFDSQGNYYKEKTDDWGVTTAYRIFGIQGHPVHRPLDDWANLKDYKLPPVYGENNTADFDNRKAYFDGLKVKGYFTKVGVSSLLERAYTIRKFEDVLADVASEDEDFLKLTDMMCERISREIKVSLDLDVDGIQFGDDFGMQSTMLISPQSFRTIYKPRFEERQKYVSFILSE